MAIDGKGAHIPQRFCGWGALVWGVSAEHAPGRSTHGGPGEGALPLHRWVIPYSPQREAACHRRQRPCGAVGGGMQPT